jgi:PhnB protein
MTAIGLCPTITISPTRGGPRAAITWYKSVFGAKVKGAFVMGPANEIGHAELLFGDVLVMLGGVQPGMCDPTADKDIEGITLTLMVSEKVQEVFDRAVQNGAKAVMEVDMKPWGWKSGSVIDPFGVRWMISEDVNKWSNKEIAEKMNVADIASEF